MKTRNFKFSLLLIIAVVFSSFSTSVFGQVPEKMSYQAVVRNASNQLVVNKQIGVLILITQGIFPPVTVYSETHIATTNNNGLLTIQLGGGTVASGNFSTIKWENGNTSVSANYDLSGGTNYTILSSSQLLSVPYALYAKSAGNATSGTTCPDGTTVGEIKYWNGTSWITVAPGLNGNVLMLEENMPVWKDFTSTTISLPQVNTISTSEITPTTVKCEGFVVSAGGESDTERGFCYAKTQNPTVVGSKIATGFGKGSFSGTLTNLEKGTIHYLRAYAANSAGTTYGEELNFKTLVEIPLLTTSAVDSVTATTAKIGGNVTDNGGSTVTAKGICWSTAPNPTIESQKYVFGNLNGPFNGKILNLKLNTKYYARAFATNSMGTAYGDELIFTTLAALPTLSPAILSSYGSDFASIKCTIVSFGGVSKLSKSGLCWATTENPTIENYSKTITADSVSTFTTEISKLSASTKYYVRAFAQNSAGIVYSDPISFTTLQAIKPEVITLSVDQATSTLNAYCMGKMTRDGGSTISEMGFCWNTTVNPTISNNKIVSESFSDTISGLIDNTTYYVRAYATNSIGTSYGNEIKFTALQIGKSFGGGKLAYVFKTGDPGYVPNETHGIIAAESDFSSEKIWGSTVSITDARIKHLGGGKLNTQMIVSRDYGAIAAKICDGLIIGEYDDWYLPSLYELEKLLYNKDLIGGFSEATYWSSSELEEDRELDSYYYDYLTSRLVRETKTYYASVYAYSAQFYQNHYISQLTKKSEENKIRAIRYF